MSLSIRAYARHRGVSHTAVQKAIKSGRISQEADGTIDPVKADDDWRNNTKTNIQQLMNQDEFISDTNRHRYDELRAAREIIKVRLNKMKLQQDRHEVIDFKEAIKGIGDMAVRWREGFETLPARIASLLAAVLEADEHTCYVALDVFVRQQLDKLADAAELTYPRLQTCFRERFKPSEYLSLSDWADQYHLLPSKSSAEPGLWRTIRTPYLKEVMDNLTAKSPAQRIVFMKGAQLGGTEMGLCWLGYVVHKDPGTFMMVEPTVDMAKRHSRHRIEPQINAMPELRALIPPARQRDSGNTVLNKDFPGGTLVLTGANSAASLRSTPARFIFMDEVDAYPVDVDGEGDPIALMERRAVTFAHRRKILLVSTPTLQATSRIAREFERSDKRYYFVPCPFCGHAQRLMFERLHWQEGKPKTAQYSCESCEKLIDERHKMTMLAQGHWQATTEGDGATQGYHLSSLYSPVGWYSWAEAAQLFEQSKARPELMKTFINTVLGEPFEEGFEAPEWERLYERREDYPEGVIPEGGLFLTAGVDVQRDRLECEIVAWGRDKESWSVGYHVLDGDTAQAKVWHSLAELLAQDWPHVWGVDLPIQVMCVDAGYATQTVYDWVKDHPQATWGASGAKASTPRTVAAIKGCTGDRSLLHSVARTHIGGKRRGLKRWNISSSVGKEELYRWLRLPKPTDEALAQGETFAPGSCHFPQYGEEYFKQLTAERMVTKSHKGFPKMVWEKDPARRNEALDCRVYARAAASIYGIDRFKDKDWQRLEDALGERPKAMPETKAKRKPLDPKKRALREGLLQYRPPMRFQFPGDLGDVFIKPEDEWWRT